MLVIANIMGINTGTGAKSPLTTHWPLDRRCDAYWKQLWVPDTRRFFKIVKFLCLDLGAQLWG